MDISKKTTTFWLGAMFIISVVLHVVRIGYPASPVFDEVHFATYASDYVKDQAFFDIHPPLGKILYAAAITLFKREPLGDTQFVAVKRYAHSTAVDTVATGLTFAHFPYIQLRELSTLFGVALPFALYWFLRSIGTNRFASLIAAGCVAFENAMLVETRLILMNGMYIVFGLVALALFFGKKWRVAGGVMWGLSLAVKLVGIVFLGPLIAAYFVQRKPKEIKAKQLVQFLIVGLAMFIFVFAGIQNIFFTPFNRLNTWIGQGMMQPDALSATIPHLAPMPAAFFTNLVEFIFFVIGNTGIHGQGLPHPAQSPWYLWPAMQVRVPYFTDAANSAKQIVLSGNFAVWIMSTLAVVFALALAWRYGSRYFRRRDEDARPLLILLGGYIFALLPYMTIVRRSTFLYHYFPALLFAIGLLGYMLDRFLRSGQFRWNRSQKIALLCIFIVIVIAGFIWAMPATYGFAFRNFHQMM